MDSVVAAEELERVIRSGLLSSVFEPVMDLRANARIGYRVLPAAEESAFADAAQVRAALEVSPIIGDLDASLRFFALQHAAGSAIGDEATLFLQSEPESFVTLEEQDRAGRTILVINARKLADSPAMVLRNIRQARSLGWEIGMSQVGGTLASCAMLPMINPCVVVLDEDLLDSDDAEHLAEVAQLVKAHAERTGAVVLCSGVDTDEHEKTIRALGVDLACGARYGEPTREPHELPAPHADPFSSHTSRNIPLQVTPFTIASALDTDPLEMDPPMLRAMLSALERRAQGAGASTMLLASISDSGDVPLNAARYSELAQLLGLVAVVTGEGPVSVPAVRSGPLDASDPLRDETNVVVLGPDWAGMVAAKRSHRSTEEETLYEVFVTADRYAVIDAARSVVSRIPAIHVG